MNLLPWRDAARQRRYRYFISMSLLGLNVLIALGYYWRCYYRKLTIVQQAVNQQQRQWIHSKQLSTQQLQDIKKYQQQVAAVTQFYQHSQKPSLLKIGLLLLTNLPNAMQLLQCSINKKHIKLVGRVPAVEIIYNLIQLWVQKQHGKPVLKHLQRGRDQQYDFILFVPLLSTVGG